MPAMACCVDSVAAAAAAAAVIGGGVAPPGFAFIDASADASLLAPGPFSGVRPATNTAVASSAEGIQWSPELSAELYRIDGWGRPYFSVNSSGNVAVLPYGKETLPHQEIDLLKVVKRVSDLRAVGGLGLQLPLVVRFPDVLKHRLESLQSAFDLAIHSQGYRARYQGVYPVKCNQDRFVVEDIVKFGAPFRFGLEAGSKPELLLAMSCLCRGNPDALLVCNGFKDSEYVSLALIARKLQLNTVIVLEQEEELEMVIELSRKFCVRPVIGVRAKLRTKHSGHFGSTSGEKGKFGLNITQILGVVQSLKSLAMLDCLQLLHFHIGSQIPSTDLLADGVSEGAQIYSELVRLGAAMGVIDIGGGLGIDYDGSKSMDSDVSVGYTLEEYASAVVRAVGSVCEKKGVAHPVICSESGRAVVSHHSILIFEAFSSSPASLSASAAMRQEDSLEGLSEEGWADYHSLSAAAMKGDYGTCLYYADKLKQRCVDLFKDGSLRIEQLAAIDALYDLVSRAQGVADPVRTYHMNLSIFTSIPDFWGIGQLFPIIPIHRLDERPGVRGILSDLTCDSDGKIDKFIGGESSLLLHEIDGGRGGGICSSHGGNSKYYLGMFLGGAYEEALGGLHNLFGGPSVVRVTQSDGPHSFAVTRAMPGSSCGDVLRAMQHEPHLMFQSLKHRAEEFILAHHVDVVDEGHGCEDDRDVSADVLVHRIALSFHNMPYLVMGAIELGNGNGCNPCYCTDVNYSTSGSEGTVGEEDELWGDMCA